MGSQKGSAGGLGPQKESDRVLLRRCNRSGRGGDFHNSRNCIPDGRNPISDTVLDLWRTRRRQVLVGPMTHHKDKKSRGEHIAPKGTPSPNTHRKKHNKRYIPSPNAKRYGR